MFLRMDRFCEIDNAAPHRSFRLDKMMHFALYHCTKVAKMLTSLTQQFGKAAFHTVMAFLGSSLDNTSVQNASSKLKLKEKTKPINC